MIVLAIIVVAILAIAALLIIFVVPLVMGPGFTSPPSVQFGPVELVNGNATFSVDSVSSETSGALFDTNLRVGSSTGTVAAIVEEPGFAVVVVWEDRYRVYWGDLGSDSLLSLGDRFTVTGDGASLPMDSALFFYLIWPIQGEVVGTRSWATPPVQRPVVTFSSVSQDGNATFSVAGATPAVYAGNYRANLRAGTDIGTATAIATTSGTYSSITVGGTVYRIYWVDVGGGGNLNAGDQFRITGNSIPLTGATQFEFYLLWAEDGNVVQSATWTTP
jgi:hypothetical protein